MTDPAPDLQDLAQTVAAASAAVRGARPLETEDVLAALHDLHLLRRLIDQLEPDLIAAARRSGASWQALAPVLGVASRQAAERRYLRLVPATPDQAGSTRDQRVRQVRDRRAGARAVRSWANDNTADLRQLAGQVTALRGLAPSSADDIARLHHALGEVDAGALPGLLAQARQHLAAHPALSEQIDAVTEHAGRLRRQTQQHRDSDGTDGHPGSA